MGKSMNSTGVLAEYFPMLRTREEICRIISETPRLNDMFQQWREEEKEEFLGFCSGARGLKVVYDGIFKEIFNPESTPERLENLLSLLLGQNVKIEAVLPNDSVRLGAESSLLYTDILVQFMDGSLSNVEIQKIGYAFPGERSACYSSDHLLRQYKRVRGDRGKHFNYRDIKNVYTIVFFERSPREFWAFPDLYLHRFRQQSDTGLKLELLQEYIFIPLDIFRKSMENIAIENELDAWLVFLSFDEPERVVELITQYPKFRAMYEDIYEVCLNMERVMSMFSKELKELDHNTVCYMIDEMQAELELAKEELEEKRNELEETKDELNQKEVLIRKLKEELEAEREKNYRRTIEEI